MDGRLPDPTEEEWRTLRNRLVRRGADPHTAEDGVQEAWLRAMERRPADHGHFKGWLYVVAARYLRQVQLTLGLRSSHLERLAREGRSPFKTAEPSSLDAYVEELPAPYREVIRLRFHQELSVREIATRVGRPEATVRTQLKRGLQRLRVRLDPDRHGRRRLRLEGLLPLWLRRPRTRRIAAGGALLIAGVGVLALRAPSTPRALALPFAHEDALAERATLDTAQPSGSRSDSGRTPLAAPPSVARIEPLSGIVRTPDGLPASGAIVHAVAANGAGPVLEAEADALGRYTLAMGRHDLVWATHPDFRPSTRCMRGSLPPGCALDLELGRTTILECTVQCADGAPGAGVRILTWAGMLPQIETATQLGFEEPEEETVCDAQGHARLKAPQAAWVEIMALRNDRPVAFQRVVPSAVLGPLVVRLPDPGVIFGSVEDRHGAPARGVTVEVLQLVSELCLRTQVEADGSFELEGLLPGPFVVRVQGKGADSARLEGRMEEGALMDVGALALGSGTTVCGRVLDYGSPVPGARIALLPESNPNAEGDILRTALSDAEGRFAFGGCSTSGHFTVYTVPTEPGVRADWAMARPGDEAIELELGAAEACAPVVLELHAHEGGPVPRLVELRSQPFASRLLEPSGDGRFRSEPLPAGSYQVFVWLSELGTWQGPTLVHDPFAPAVHALEVPRGTRLDVELELPEGFQPGPGLVVALTPTFNAFGMGRLNATVAHRLLDWDAPRGVFSVRIPPQDTFVASTAFRLAAVAVPLRVEDVGVQRVVLRQALGADARISFRAPRALTYGEVVGLDLETPDGPIHVELHWTDLLERPQGFAFEVSLPRRATRIRASTRPLPGESVAALRGARDLAPTELTGASPVIELELVPDSWSPIEVR